MCSRALAHKPVSAPPIMACDNLLDCCIPVSRSASKDVMLTILHACELEAGYVYLVHGACWLTLSRLMRLLIADDGMTLLLHPQRCTRS